MSDDAPPVLDLTPRIRRKQAATCPHEYVEVDVSVQSLTCDACGCELDPWWFLRRMATESEEEQAKEEAKRQAAHAQYAEWVEAANARLRFLNEEVKRLTDVQNRLWNTQVDGRPLGSLPRTRRRKASGSGLPTGRREPSDPT